MKPLKITCLLLLFFSCSSNSNSEYGNIREVPKEARKCIITKHYEPLLHEGEWICGKEYEYYSLDHIADTVYYDEYDNILLRSNNREGIIDKYIYIIMQRRNKKV